MSKGLSGLFSGTAGDRAAAGSANLMSPEDNFLRYIRKRKDVDANGYYDVIAHGTPNTIIVAHNGRNVEVSHRVLANLLKHDQSYKGGSIRLLSCSTGSKTGQFAQNLANKLGAPVKAPTDLLWAYENGSYRVAPRRHGSSNKPDSKKSGSFKTFYPRKGKQ